MKQIAPDPVILFELVEGLDYKDGWVFTIKDIDRGQGSVGLTLLIDITTTDSYHPDEKRRVHHYMLVPPAAFDMRSWRRWLFDQVLLVEQHEACEFFKIEGVRPYAPSHGPGNDPYMIRELGDQLDVKTSYRGTVNP